MQLHLNITDESKAIFLLELLQSLDYIEIIEDFMPENQENDTQIAENELSKEQIAELDRCLEDLENVTTKLYSWEELLEEEKEAIEEGIFQADNNMIVSHDVMLKKMEKWLIK